MGAYRRKLKIVVGIIKDRASLIKSTLSTRRRASSIRRVILRATTHGDYSASPPSDYRIEAVLSLGQGSRVTACACVQALMDRLHGTRNVSVALKCLYVVHTIIAYGSFILKDQLSVYPCSGGRDFLNMSTFRDSSDPETWEMSMWVRWYADVLEQIMMISRVLGYHLHVPRSKKEKVERVLQLSNSDLVKEMNVAVDFVEQVGNGPESFYLQKNDLIYGIVRLVRADHRLVQREILLRVGELGKRMDELSCSELIQFLSCLQRLQNCRQRLSQLFGNRKMNSELWDLVRDTRGNLVSIMEAEREKKALAIEIGTESTELIKFGQVFQYTSSGGWLSLNSVSC